MRHTPTWEAWEAYACERLGLDRTIASGSQFHDKGDGVDYGQGDWAFQIDAKYTETLSYRVRGREFFGWVSQAVIRGKHFALVVRQWPRGERQPHDLAVIPFELFVAMVTRIRELEDARA